MPSLIVIIVYDTPAAVNFHTCSCTEHKTILQSIIYLFRAQCKQPTTRSNQKYRYYAYSSLLVIIVYDTPAAVNSHTSCCTEHQPILPSVYYSFIYWAQCKRAPSQNWRCFVPKTKTAIYTTNVVRLRRRTIIILVVLRFSFRGGGWKWQDTITFTIHFDSRPHQSSNRT
jgi:hypothetical protein